MKLEKNGLTVMIPDVEIENNMSALGISQEEAINLWLEDNGYEDNEEQNELNAKAAKVKIDHGTKGTKHKTHKKPERKVSDEKQEIFNVVVEALKEKYGDAVNVTNPNKIVEVELNGIHFKLDLIQRRPPKS